MMNKLTTITNVRAFVFGGNATFTLVSGKTGTRFTYKVQAHKEREHFFFVDLLAGEENTEDYRHCGVIFRNDADQWEYRTSRSALGFVQELAMQWFTHRLNLGKDIDPAVLEFWSSSKCSACNRTLTVPESIERGMGPVCFAKTNLRMGF